MYSKRNPPSKVSGKNPAFQKDDYPTARQKKTQQDLINEGKKFKFSVFKKPYADNSTYQEMEYEATPAGRTGLNLPPFPIVGWQGNEPPTWSAEGKCWCEGCNFDGIGIYDVECSPFGGDCHEGDQTWLYFSIVSDRMIVFSISSPCNDTVEMLNESTIPFPDEEKCSEVRRCYWIHYRVNIDCSPSCSCDGNDYRQLVLIVCEKKYPFWVKCCPCQCSTLTIVNEDGTPATDTILRNGQLDFKTTGNCCEDIVWSVTVDSGSTLGGSTISQSGVLTAGATSCGSLKVTATCAACGTSVSQYVRVTEGGQWVFSHWCNPGSPYPNHWDSTGTGLAIEGKYKYSNTTRSYTRCKNNPECYHPNFPVSVAVNLSNCQGLPTNECGSNATGTCWENVGLEGSAMVQVDKWVCI